MADEKKDEERKNVGVYICYCGGNISDHVDVEKVRERMEKMPEVAVARTHMFMCSDPGQELIMEDLKNGTIERVVVASCAPSLHETTFRGAVARAGANPYIYEHANIREQVSWVHHGEQATDKATRLVSMAADLVHELTRQVLKDAHITVHTCSVVETFSGYVGNFNLGVKRQPPESAEDQKIIAQINDSHPAVGHPAANKYIPFAGVYTCAPPSTPETFTIETGVIVLATGFQSYTPFEGEYGFGKYEQVITLPELIRSMAENGGSGAENRTSGNQLMLGGKIIRSLAMIHCVGSRQIPGIHQENEEGTLNEYCSRTCCTATLNAANRVRETYPGTRIYEFYRDIRTYGRGQEELYEQAARNEVVFLRFEAGDSPEVIGNNPHSGDYALLVKVKDSLTFGEEVEAPVDLVVLATGIEPNNVSSLVNMMKLPVGTDRFLLEVHPKLRPVELPISGILIAGTCQAPMDVGETCNAAGAVAAKAAALLGRGYVELDPFVAEVDLEKCKGTGACVDACLSDGALNLAEMAVDGQKVMRAQVTPAFCIGCGACVGVCPENAIDIAGWTLKQYEAMIDRIVAEEVVA